MKKLFAILILSFTWLEALDLDEMLGQEFIEPTSTCDVNYQDIVNYDNLPVWCNEALLMNEYESKVTAIMDNFYFSYRKILAKHINVEDKNKIDDMVKNMLAKQDECQEMANNIELPDGANSIIPFFELTSCLQDEYGKSFYELSSFIYDNPKYKHIFDEIFTPNPKGYYELIKSSKDLRKIIDKAAKDNLIDNTGKLIAHTNELSKPSFDCTKAKSEVEKLICSNKETASLDKLYSKLYFGILNSIPKDTKLGQTTRANLKTFNKNLLEYRDNMRCFFLDYNNDEKEVQETDEILGDNGVPLYANEGVVLHGFSTQEQKQACVQRVYLMGILLLATNTLQDTTNLKKEYIVDSKPYLIDIFSIKYLHNFELYDTFFPKEFKDKLSDITKTLGYLSDISRDSHDFDYDEGFICSGGECGVNINIMKNEVEKPVKEFVKKIKF